MKFRIKKTRWAIQNIKTGLFMPPIPKGQRAGSTHLEFGPNPRLFTERQYAKNSARWWVNGKVSVKFEYNEWEGDGDIEWEQTAVKGRDINDLRVVPVTLTFGTPEVFNDE